MRNFGKNTNENKCITKKLYDIYINLGFIVGYHYKRGFPYAKGSSLTRSDKYNDDCTAYIIPPKNSHLLILDIDDIDVFNRLCKDLKIFDVPEANGYSSTGNPIYFIKKPIEVKFKLSYKDYKGIDFINEANHYYNALGQYMWSKENEWEDKNGKVHTPKKGATGIYTYNHNILWEDEKLIGGLCNLGTTKSKKEVTIFNMDSFFGNVKDDTDVIQTTSNTQIVLIEDTKEIKAWLKWCNPDVGNDDWSKIIFAIFRRVEGEKLAKSVAIEWSESGAESWGRDVAEVIDELWVKCEERDPDTDYVSNFKTIQKQAKIDKTIKIKEEIKNGTFIFARFDDNIKVDREDFNEFELKGEDIKDLCNDIYFSKRLIEEKQFVLKGNSTLTDLNQIAILEDIFNRFFVMEGGLRLLDNAGQIVKVTSERSFIIKCLFLYKNYKNLTTFDNKGKPIFGINWQTCWDLLFSHNNNINIEMINDPFYSKNQIIFENMTTKIINIECPLIEPKINPKALEFYDVIAKDYKAHFKELNTFLDMIIYGKFTTDGKKAQLYTQFPSDWGKSELMKSLIRLGVGVELKYNVLANLEKTSVDPLKFTNKWVFMIDEFTVYPKVLKEMDDNIQMAGKNQLAKNIKVPLMWMLSAEDSPSFSGGVDKQIRNRVSVMRIEEGNMLKRPIYKENINYYSECVDMLLYKELKQKYDDIVVLGRHNSGYTARAGLNKIWDKWKIPECENIEDMIKDTILDTLNSILSSNNPKTGFIRECCFKVIGGKYKGYIAVKAFKKVMGEVLEYSLHQKDFKKTTHKISEYCKMLNGIDKSQSSISGEWEIIENKTDGFGEKIPSKILKGTLKKIVLLKM